MQMKTSDDILTLIIPQPTNKNKKKHYTRASLINSTQLDDKLEDIMDEELLYGYVDFY